MNKSKSIIILTRKVSYWQVFRLIFIMFCLYLLRDVFSRWDGFKYYASFSEFLPSVALVTILWTILAVFTALLVWLLLRAFEWFCLRIGWKIKVDHLLLFTGLFVFLVAMGWVSKRLILPHAPLSNIVKGLVILCAVLTAVYLTWLLRNKPGIIHERITPLVWLFSICFILSVPLVVYNTWTKQDDIGVSQKDSLSSIVDKTRPNIILVTFDALTTWDMSVYGYHRPTTPFISEWAKGASLFKKVEAESNFTTSTTASLMTGKRVWTHQTYHVEGSKSVKGNSENLALVLKKNGYKTMAFVVNPFASVKTLGIANGFEIAPVATKFSKPSSLFGWEFGIIDVLLYQLFGDKIKIHDWIVKKDFILFRLLNVISRNVSKTEVPPEKAFKKFLEIIDNNTPEPFFAWIHLFPPHDPYLPPEPYMGMFDSSAELRRLKSQEQLTYQYFSQEMQPEVETLRARYNEFVRYCDKQFEDFITQLTKRGKLKNTVIILSSDHGESFEHGYLTHGNEHLYEQVTNIPLIIKEPDQSEGRIINDIAEQIDIPATILELAHIPVPSWMEGRSLVPLMRGKRLLSRPAFSMNFEKNPSRGHQITKGTIAVWEGDYKLIHYLQEKKSLLFNLKKDPRELNNLFDREPEIGKHLLSLIHENLKRANERIKKGEY